jgi:hypothetical protein
MGRFYLFVVGELSWGARELGAASYTHANLSYSAGFVLALDWT